MSLWPTRIARRLHAMLRRSAVERDMDDEMRMHLELEAAELERAGLSTDEALRQARAVFGGVLRFKEESRDALGLRVVDDLAQDVRYAWRQLRANLGFTAASVLTLALGIGATTTVYTLWTAVLKQPFAVSNGNRLVHLGQGRRTDARAGYYRMARGNYVAIRGASRTLEDVSLIGEWNPIVRGTERADVLDGAIVSSSLFHALGTRALLGRTIAPADSDERAGSVVVISDGLWRSRFGADSAIIGRTIVLDGIRRSIIGVVDERSVYPRAEVWAPRAPRASDVNDRHWTDWDVVARLRPGVDLARARAELRQIAAAVAVEDPGEMSGSTFGAVPLADTMTEGSDDLWIFSGAFVVLLTIACINLGGLLLARLTVRHREIAVRAAMGAGSARLFRQLLTETMVLSLAGGVAGAVLAQGATRAIATRMPSFILENVPELATMHVDVRALVLALSLGVATGVAIGIWPALRFARPALLGALNDGAQQATASERISRTRRTLVVVQIAFAIVLLVAAGLLVRTTRNLYAQPLGFRPDHLLTFRLHAPPRADSTVPIDSLRFQRVLDHLGRLPGVLSAATTFGLPYSHAMSTTGFQVVGRKPLPPNRRPWAQNLPASSEYFATMSIRVLRGRGFTREDRAGSPRIAVINDVLARRYFANEDPIGRELLIDSTRWRVVGIVADIRQGTSGFQTALAAVYRPATQWLWLRTVHVVMRTAGDPAALMPTVTRAVHELDPDLAITKAESMDAMIAEDRATVRVVLGMMAGFAAAALLISVIGLYGLTNYAVAQRAREFGIRFALGASRRDVVAHVLGDGIRLTAMGAAAGLAIAIAVTRFMRSMLFGVSPLDPATLIAVAVAMCGVGLLASYAPARRAGRVDPMVSLRQE